jgi:hypothetical protein
MPRCEASDPETVVEENGRERTFLIQCQLQQGHEGPHEAQEAGTREDGRPVLQKKTWS